ncbi:hypothetical protein BDR07DRAFT_1412067 [Suillus spraguei]|nr:hypothetical protein BDR07DRAFT_1412067 [Suillus spraguei]
MIEVAQETLKKMPVSTGQYEYVQASAESLPCLEDSSVDPVIAGACLAKVLRKNGSAAFCIPSEFCFTHYPSLTTKINAYGRGIDPLNSVSEGNEVVPSILYRSVFRRIVMHHCTYPLPISPFSTLCDHAQEDDVG